MKAERRHELKENDLTHALMVARDYLDQNGKRIGLAAVIVLAIVVAVAWTVRSQGAAIENKWRRKSELSFADPQVGRESVDVLAGLMQGVSDERFVLAGLIDLGQQALRLAGQVAVPPDRQLTERARDAFEQLLQRFGDNPFVIGVAHLGLATAEENFFALDGDPAHKSEVEKHLAAIIDDPALDGMPFKRMAMDRRNSLERTFTPVTFDYPVPPPEEPLDRAAENTQSAPVDVADSSGPGESAAEVSVAPPDAGAEESDQPANPEPPPPNTDAPDSEDADQADTEADFEAARTP